MSITTKDGIEYKFNGHLDKENVIRVAKSEKFRYFTDNDNIEHTYEGNSPKTLITGYVMSPPPQSKIIGSIMPPQLRSLLIEISDFEQLGPHIKNYFVSQGLTPGSRHRPSDSEVWKVYERYKKAVLENCGWDRLFGIEGEDAALKHLAIALELDWI